MVDRLGDQPSFFSLTESFSLGWLVCFAIFGLAYYTNPSEKSFRNFLDKFPISTHRSLPKIDVHSNRGDHTLNRSKVKTHQQSLLKINSASRNLKNSNQPSPSPPQTPFPPLITSPFNKHNLLLCTLISVDRTQNLTLNISFDHSIDDSYPQLEWFLGCFDTWFALRRQILPAIASLPTFSIHQTLKTIWNQWTWPIPDLLLPQKPSIDTSLHHSSPIAKPKRKKSHRSSKGPSLQCQTSYLCGHSAQCSLPEQLFAPPISGVEPDLHLKIKPSPIVESVSSLATPTNPSVSPSEESNPPRVDQSSPVVNIPYSALPIPPINQISQTDNPPHENISDQLAQSHSEPLSDRPSSPSPLPPPCDPCPVVDSSCGLRPESLTPSDCREHLEANSHLSSPDDHARKSKETPIHSIPNTLNKVNSQASLKESSHVKEPKVLKQVNSTEKHNPLKSPQANLTRQSLKGKVEGVLSHRQSASTNTKQKKDSHKNRKEEEKVKTPTRPIKVDTSKLPKVKDAKVTNDHDSKEKLTTRQTDSTRKREVNLKQPKPSNIPVVTRQVDRLSPVQDQLVTQPTTASYLPFCSSALSTSHDSTSPINLYHTFPLTSNSPVCQSPNLLMPYQPENYAPSLQPLDVTSPYPTSDPWASDPWSEAVQQSHIRDSFITLPNLERSALKDHYIVRGPDLDSPLHPIFPPSLTDEVFNCHQELNLPSHMTNSPEWALPPPIQTTPYGVIGQQGLATTAPSFPSPVSNSSLTRFPGPQVHPSQFMDNFSSRPSSARNDGIARTNSSQSLSQLSGYRSTRSSPSLSPYASIATSLHSKHSALTEACECPRDPLNGRNWAYPPNLGTADSYDARVPEGRMTELPLGCSAALRLNGIPRDSMPFDSVVPSSINSPVTQRPSSSLSEHQTAQSLGTIPQHAVPTFNSIFDGDANKNFPLLSHSNRHKRSGPSLNPSAQAFAFGGSKATPTHSPCPSVSSVDRQRARGYSHSTVPTPSHPFFHESINHPNHPKIDQHKVDSSKNLLKSLHRSSWSVALDSKGDFSPACDFKFQTYESNFKHDDSHSNSGNRPGYLSELAKLPSTEDVLPAVRSKSASSGIFGSIGDTKAKKTSASSSTNVSPSAPCSVLQSPFRSPAQLAIS